MNPRTMLCFSAVISAVCALGCSDPEPQAAAVGLTLHVGSPDSLPGNAQGCSGIASREIGNPAPSMGQSGKTYAKGQGGLTAASCSVKGKKTFSVSANIAMGKGTHFTISSGTIDSETGTGTFKAQIFTSETVGTTSEGAMDCNFTVPDSGDYTVKSGALYAKFSCPLLRADNAVEAYCGANGDVVLEYCDE